MNFILASIVSSTAIYIIFKIAKRYSCSIPSLITINYFSAAFLGFALFMEFTLPNAEIVGFWVKEAVFVGILFTGMFYLIGISSLKAGIAITTLANKLSVVFPVIFSVFYFQEEITSSKIIGISGALLAIFLAVYKRNGAQRNLKSIILPVAIFVGSGITDSLVKFAQEMKIMEHSAQFSVVVFLVAFVIALLVSISGFRNTKPKLHYPTLLFGILLGLVNFGSLYFLISALNSNFSSSVVFISVNISVVVLSAISGRVIFNEKLTLTNIAGILLALTSFYLLFR